MNRNPARRRVFADNEHPGKDAMLRVRETILADDRLTEAIKWKSPTFTFRGNIASFNPRTKAHVSLMFHTGASAPSTLSVVLLGEILEPLGVQLVRRDLQLIAGWSGLQPPAVGTERRAQPVHEYSPRMNAGASCAISSNFNTIEYSVPGGLHAISTTSAIVSTAYSAPLSFSSMISKDIYAQYINSDAPERRQVQVGKVAFWDPVAGVIGRSGAGGLQCDGRYAEGRELG